VHYYLCSGSQSVRPFAQQSATCTSVKRQKAHQHPRRRSPTVCRDLSTACALARNRTELLLSRIAYIVYLEHAPFDRPTASPAARLFCATSWQREPDGSTWTDRTNALHIALSTLRDGIPQRTHRALHLARRNTSIAFLAWARPRLCTPHPHVLARRSDAQAMSQYAE